MKSYGVDLPGGWFVLGMLDTVKEEPNEEVGQISSIENVVDAYAKLIALLYTSSIYKIIPVLIFRAIRL